MRSAPPGPGEPESEHELTPEEAAAWDAGLERVKQERRRALQDPGPSWREWFFYDHAKWWVGLAFLIVDAWIVTAFVQNGSLTADGFVETLALLAVAIYLEVLLYRFLWRRPAETRRRGRFRPSWTGLTEVGRWTPEGERLRRGVATPAPADGSPNPKEFL